MIGRAGLAIAGDQQFTRKMSIFFINLFRISEKLLRPSASGTILSQTVRTGTGHASRWE
jgi:hypothetical protein